MRASCLYQVAGSRSFASAVDADAELHRVDPAKDANSADVLADAEDDVADDEVLLVAIRVAVAAIENGAGAGLTEVHHELSNVPGLVDLGNLSTAWLSFIEVLLAVDFLVTHL